MTASKRKKSQPRNTKAKKQQRREEILGLCICVLGILLFVFVYSSSPGEWGNVVKDVLFGTFGILAYGISFIVAAIGIAIIVKRSRKIKWSSVALWSVFILCIICAFHIVFQKNYDLTNFSVYISSSYAYSMTYKLGAGAFAGILSYPFVSTIGIAGAYVVFAAYIIIVVVVKTRIPLRKIGTDLGDRINEKASDVKSTVSDYIASKNQYHHKSSANKLFIDDLKGEHEDDDEDDIKILDSLDFSKSHMIDNSTGTDDEIDADLPQVFKTKQAPKKKYSVSETAWDKALEEAKSVEDDDMSDEESSKYIFPPIDLMTRSSNTRNSNMESECRENAIKLEDTLENFGIRAKVMQVSRGPAVTRFELKPPAGVKISKITNLSNDIALSLAAPGVRIEAPIPGKAAIGIEVPNRTVSIVKLRDIIESRAFTDMGSNLAICLGKDIAGKNVVADLASMPHMLIAGATGSGKSVCINGIIISMIYKSSPEDVKMIMIDPKRVELNVYNNIPHLLIPVVTDAKKAAGALNWAIKEMTDRYQLFSDVRARDIYRYNELAEQNSEMKKMPHIVIIIDELADLMAVAASEVEDAICRLAQLARAAGMHLVIATQRPSVDVITGLIKANIPTRVAFAVSAQVDSRTILDMGGAEKLLGRGDMLFAPNGSPKPIRLQGAYVSDSEVESITSFIKKDKSSYNKDIIKDVDEMAAKDREFGDDEDDELDELVPQAIDVIYSTSQASISMIQRKLRVGYARAARLMDDIESLGIVSQSEGSKPRQILKTHAEAMRLAQGDYNER